MIQLTGINPVDIEVKYGIRKNVGKNSTKIENIPENKNVEYVNFIDDLKRGRKCFIAISDKGKNCYWCRHPIYNPSQHGIGCPISYNPNILTKTYLSEISHDNFTIKEQVTDNKAKLFQKTTDTRIKIERRNFYDTYGFFCSFNCCMAFIEDNKHNAMFVNSKFLLSKIYVEYNDNIEIGTIQPAPNWQLLSEYGGTLSIEEFRNSFNNIEYKDCGVYIPERKIGVLFEKSHRI